MDKRQLTLYNTTVENVFIYLYEQLKQISYKTIEYRRTVNYSNGTTREVTYRWCIQAVRPPKNNRIELNASYVIEPEGKDAQGYPNMGAVIIFQGFQLRIDSVQVKIEFNELFEEYVNHYLEDLKEAFGKEEPKETPVIDIQPGVPVEPAEESRLDEMYRTVEIYHEQIPLALDITPEKVSDYLSMTFRNKGTLSNPSATIVMMPFQAKGASGFIDYYSPSTDSPITMSLERGPIAGHQIDFRGLAIPNTATAVLIEEQAIITDIASRVSERFGRRPDTDAERNKWEDKKEVYRPNLTRETITNLLKAFVDDVDNLPYPIRSVSISKIDRDGYDDFELHAELRNEPDKSWFGRVRITDRYIETHCYYQHFEWMREFFERLVRFLCGGDSSIELTSGETEASIEQDVTQKPDVLSSEVPKQPETFEPQPWMIIPERWPDRLIVEYWWQGYINSDIAKKVHWEKETVTKRLSELRGLHGEKVVPYSRTIKNLLRGKR